VNLLNKSYALTLCGCAVVALGGVCPKPAGAMQTEGRLVANDAARAVQRPGDFSQESLPDPKLKLSPIEALRKFEPAADEEYTLGAGMKSPSSILAGRFGKQRCDWSDGRMTLPLAGPIKLAGLTREAAGQTIVEAMSPYYTKLTATVQVVKYGSNHVTLLGT